MDGKQRTPGGFRSGGLSCPSQWLWSEHRDNLCAIAARPASVSTAAQYDHARDAAKVGLHLINSKSHLLSNTGYAERLVRD